MKEPKLWPLFYGLLMGFGVIIVSCYGLKWGLGLATALILSILGDIAEMIREKKKEE